MTVLRPFAGLAIAWGTMTLLGGAFVVGASPQSSPARATWRGIKTVVATGPRCEWTNREEFTWVEETDPTSARRWVSRQVSWDNSGSCRVDSAIAIVDGRRTETGWSVHCTARGSMDLKDWNGEQIHPRCEESPPGLSMFGKIAPEVYNGPGTFSPVDRSELRDGCTYDRRWVDFLSSGMRVVTTESIWLDEADVNAKVFPNSNFEPTPGATFRLYGRANVPVRWKFVLVESSRLRGYATNADVDPAFFEIYDLPSLRGRYGTMDPDLIFDPSKYEPPWDQTGQWKRPYPDSGPHKWSILESKEEWLSVDAYITTMDFGAHGELQVYVSSKCGGGWVPVEVVKVGDTTGTVGITLPPDDADGNFIPDWLKAYSGLAPLEDKDGQPVGDGTAGDGFTAFEEYRGFITQVGTSCNSPLHVKHVRTDPAVKDLFIHSSDPVLWRAAVSGFDKASGLASHMICPKQYVNDDTRVVNFTMQLDPGEGIRGAKLTQDFPQHGLHLVNERLAGENGMQFPRPGADFGPPRNTDRVAVDLAAVFLFAFIQRTTIHELGHAVGIRHHGDRNLRGPVVLLNMPSCLSWEMSEGTVAGDHACLATFIALRGEQNSGNAECPMKYVNWSWYVPPGASLVPVGSVDFRPAGSYIWQRRRELPGYVTRVNPVHRYRTDLDTAMIARQFMAQSPGKFCVAPTGTGINALPGDQNHAGDSTRYCAHQLRVNDKP